MTSLVPFRSLNEIPWYLRIVLWLQKRKFGFVLNPSLLWVYTPAQFFAFSLYYLAIERKSSPISPGLRSLVMVRVAQLNWCAFCIDINASLLLTRTESKEKALALKDWQKSQLFTEQEMAALAYAESMTLNDRNLAESVGPKLKLHFSDAAIVELTGIIAYQNLSARFNAALNISPQGFCELDLGR